MCQQFLYTARFPVYSGQILVQSTNKCTSLLYFLNTAGKTSQISVHYEIELGNRLEKVCISIWMKNVRWKCSGNEMRGNAQEMTEF